MSDYETLLKLVNDERIDAGLSLNKDLGKKFCLGMTRYMWRYGCIGDGHERITDAQRYFSANREFYGLVQNLEENRFAAMTAKADLLEAEEAMLTAVTEIEKLRASAKVGRAKASVRRALDNSQDLIRGVDEMSKIIAELEPTVMAQYPEGIEQAEEDNWIAVAQYRLLKEQVQGMARQPLDSIPLRPEVKAQIGLASNRMDAIAPLQIANLQAAGKLLNSRVLQEIK